MIAVFKHEISTYFTTMMGCVFCAFVLLFAGIYTMAVCLYGQYNEFEYVFGSMGFVFLIAVPILTMRVLAEERRQKTDQLLYSLPISTTKVVLGKYMALLVVLLLSTAVISTYPLFLLPYGDINLLASFGAAVGFFLMGSAYLAVGLFVSSATENQVLAAGLSFIVLLVNYFLTNIASMIDSSAVVSFGIVMATCVIFALIIYLMTKSIIASLAVGLVTCGITAALYFTNAKLFANLAPTVLAQLSIANHHYNLMYGSFKLTDMLFYVSVSVVFVFLSVQSLEKRRWS